MPQSPQQGLLDLRMPAQAPDDDCSMRIALGGRRLDAAPYLGSFDLRDHFKCPYDAYVH